MNGHKKLMSKTQKITLGILLILACAIWLVIFLIMSQRYEAWSHQPLGPTLADPTEFHLPATWTSSPMATQPTSTTVSTATFESQTPNSPFMSCNMLPTITVLAIGTDVRAGERLVFPEGPQHLNGEQALTLARLRNKSVFVRAENQNMVMCALRKKLESPEVVLRLPAIINSFMNNVQTDLSPEQISQLACLGTQMPRSNILFASFPRELFRSDEVYDAVLEQNVSIWDANFDTMRSYVSKFQAGTWPSSSPAGTPEPGLTRGCD